jgi:hypothetical protein
MSGRVPLAGVRGYRVASNSIQERGISVARCLVHGLPWPTPTLQFNDGL